MAGDFFTVAAKESPRRVRGRETAARIARACRAIVSGHEHNGSFDGVFFRNSRIRSGQITDGLSKTVVVGERMSRMAEATWLGSITGSEVVHADGSVRLIPDEVDLTTFRALATRAGGETVAMP